MKTKILSFLSMFLLVAVVANAQEATTYRGAFAPAPTPMWTDNWTNWDPQNTFYAASSVNVTGVITTNTTWTRNNVYNLQGLVFVDSLVTLTIEAGTVIKGDATTVSAGLIVQRGATIIANGTPCNPIVFTSSKDIGARLRGDWAGVIILGRAVNNVSNDLAIEGIGTTNVRARHGGTDNADNSGIFKYVRIEYAGYVFGASNEINSFTMGSVGTGTTIDYVQTSFGNDDSFEWFGGTVNAKHLVSYRTVDDAFDTDNGYSGLVQFALDVKDPAVADLVSNSTSEGFESDNNAAGTEAMPKTTASFYNVTQVGAFRCGSNAGGITQPTADGFRRGARLRRSSELKIFNSILMNNWRGLFIDGTAALANGAANKLQFRNNIIAMDTTIAWAAPYTGVARIGEDAASRNFIALAANTNTILNTPCDILANAWNFLNPDYRPNPAFGSSGAALSGADFTPGLQLETGLFTANQVGEALVDIFEVGVGNSNGTITVSIPVLSGWDIKVPGIATLTSTPVMGTNGTAAALGADYFNADWLFSLVGGNVIATSKVGVTIPAGGSTSLGFTLTRKASTPNGTNQFFSATVSGGADSTPGNNSAGAGLGAN